MNRTLDVIKRISMANKLFNLYRVYHILEYVFLQSSARLWDSYSHLATGCVYKGREIYMFFFIYVVSWQDVIASEWYNECGCEHHSLEIKPIARWGDA